MSTNDDDRSPTGTQDDCQGPPASWSFNLPLLVLVVVVCIFLGGFIFLVLGWLAWVLLLELITHWWRDQRAKSREPIDDCCELEERGEPVEDPRRSEGSVGSCCEFEELVKAKARLMV